LVHQQGEAERWHAEAERQRQRLQQAAAEIDAILEALEPPPDLTAPGDAPATP
jgi:regulator of protease activity HflC (stomatin/prohibitin superfamily)